MEEQQISLSDVSGYVFDISMTPVPPPTISLADILNESEVVKQKEDADKADLLAIETMTFDSLKAALIRWANSGFPNAFPIHEFVIVPPPVCSDGVTRNLSDYIVFLTTKTIRQLVDTLQERLVDITASFAYTGGSAIQVVVSR